MKTEALEHFAVGTGARLVGHETSMVHAMGHHDHGTSWRKDVPEPSRGDLAHADDGRGVPRRVAHGGAEPSHLARFVPLGVIEEGQVVNRHHAGDLGPPGHGVVGTVVHLDRWRVQACDDRGETGLLVQQARQAAGGSDRYDPLPRRRERPPGAVVTPGEEREPAVGTTGESPGQFDDIPAGSHWLAGHRAERPARPRAHRCSSRRSSPSRPLGSDALPESRMRPRGLDPTKSGGSPEAPCDE